MRFLDDLAARLVLAVNCETVMIVAVTAGVLGLVYLGSRRRKQRVARMAPVQKSKAIRAEARKKSYDFVFIYLIWLVTAVLAFSSSLPVNHQGNELGAALFWTFFGVSTLALVVYFFTWAAGHPIRRLSDL